MAHKKDSGPCCDWTDADDAVLICKLHDCKDIRMQSESGWKPQVWHLCAEALKGSTGMYGQLPESQRVYQAECACIT